MEEVAKGEERERSGGGPKDGSQSRLRQAEEEEGDSLKEGERTEGSGEESREKEEADRGEEVPKKEEGKSEERPEEESGKPEEESDGFEEDENQNKLPDSKVGSSRSNGC